MSNAKIVLSFWLFSRINIEWAELLCEFFPRNDIDESVSQDGEAGPVDSTIMNST